MKWSRFFIPTVKEVPADAEIPSHRLMIRAGLMRKVASGTYFYLPLGNRTLNKIIEIVRAEINAAGALETTVPVVQPAELWQQTGRDIDYGETLGKFVDRHGRDNVLSPTAEEVFTFIAANEINSYKQLPINMYQIGTKYRDEFRPRFGVLRSREFIMKDAYSFDADDDMLEQSYRAMYNAYCRIFQRCGLEYVIVEAETGEIGGSGSHQFTIPCENGEDMIVYTEDGRYAANIEKAGVDAIPPVTVDVAAPAMEEVHTPNVGSIEAVCAFLKTSPQQMIKTLIYSVEGQTVVAVLRGDHELNPEKLTQLVDRKQCLLADEATIQQVTGAGVGFAGPMGLASKVSLLLIDHAVAAMTVGIAGANKTDYHTRNVVPGRDFPLSGEHVKVVDIRNAVPGDTRDGKTLLFKRGIEVGQVFKLGTKYSTKLNANFLDENGKSKPCLMGCYGIGINRIMASAIELGFDNDGIIWPITIAPFEVLITAANQNDEQVAGVAEKLYNQLCDCDIDVLLDDRTIRAGGKFKDADLIGIPVRITVGQRGIAEGTVEIKLRRDSETQTIAIDTAADKTVELVQKLYDEILDGLD